MGVETCVFQSAVDFYRGGLNEGECNFINLPPPPKFNLVLSDAFLFYTESYQVVFCSTSLHKMHFFFDVCPSFCNITC